MYPHEMMCLFTRPQMKADVPKARPTRSQLGLAVSGLELVNTERDPTENNKNTDNKVLVSNIYTDFPLTLMEGNNTSNQ